MPYSKPSVYYLIYFLANICKIFKEGKNIVLSLLTTDMKLPVLLVIHSKYTCISSLKSRMTLGPVFTRIVYVFTSLLLRLYREVVQQETTRKCCTQAKQLL